MYRETAVTPLTGALLIASVFVLIFGVWVIFPRELHRQECLYAAEAAEYSFFRPAVTAHETPIRNSYPLYPALAALLDRAGVPMENALRLITVFFIAAGSVLVYFSAATGSGARAGLAGAAMYCSTFLMLDKGVDGAPETMSAFFLLSAQMCLFYFGLRRGRWNAAWPGAALLLAAGYLTGGTPVLVLFVVPLLFLRRLISGRAKYRNWGFAAAAALLALICLGKVAVQWNLERTTTGGTLFFTGFSDPDYVGDFLLYWPLLFVKLLPWSAIAWIPFCVALQQLDDKPLFSKYLRVLVMVTAVLLWLIPGMGPRDLLYLPGALSILCGVYYELGMRRYGERIRKMAPAAEYAAPIIILFIVAGCFAPEKLLWKFMSLGNTLNFRNQPENGVAILAGAIGILAIGAGLRLLRRELPVWIMLLGVSVMVGIFSGVMLLPYRAQDVKQGVDPRKEDASKWSMGLSMRYILESTIRNSVKKKGPAGRRLEGEALKAEVKNRLSRVVLYKSGIGDLYGELFYAGVRVKRLRSVDELPDPGPLEVYLISDGFPQNPKWSWTNLLPEGYTYQKQRVMLWRGKRNQRGKLSEK